jgi:hypothetical protein
MDMKLVQDERNEVIKSGQYLELSRSGPSTVEDIA